LHVAIKILKNVGFFYPSLKSLILLVQTVENKCPIVCTLFIYLYLHRSFAVFLKCFISGVNLSLVSVKRFYC